MSGSSGDIAVGYSLGRGRYRRVARDAGDGYPRFAELLGAGFDFFAIHTAIDSLMSGSGKHIPEESAKLISTALLAAAALTALMTRREPSAEGRAVAPPSA